MQHVVRVPHYTYMMNEHENRTVPRTHAPRQKKKKELPENRNLTLSLFLR